MNNKYELGDIVWVKNILNKQSSININHLFVIISNDGEAVPVEYFGFVVSSNLSKSKFNSKFKYNEPLNKSSSNHLIKDSIVKCDVPYNIKSSEINYKIGSVDIEDLLRFLNSYKKFLKSNEI